MTLLRSLLFMGALTLAVLVFGLAIALLGRVLPYEWSARTSRAWARVCLGALRMLCGLDYRIRGLETLPARASVVLCKHQSAWETIAIRALLPLEQTWVLKRELTRVPVFGWALAPFEPISIDRSQGRRALRQMLNDGARALAAGRWVVIFPEGTRVPPGERGQYFAGGALLAERAGVPIVPVSHNAGVFWARRSLLKYPGTIDLVIGPAIEPAGRSAAELNREAEEWIEATARSLPLTREAA